MSFWRSILFLAVLAAVVSCRSLTAPPGFASSGSGTAGRIEFPAGTSLEAQYSLLVWYDEQHGQEAHQQAASAYGVALNARNERATLLRGNAAQILVGRFPGFAYIPPQGGIAFLYESLGARADFEAMDAMLLECQQTLQGHQLLTVPVEECIAFLEETAIPQEVELFRQWAQAHGQMEVGWMDEQTMCQLEMCREALCLKHRIQDGVEAAQSLRQEGGHDREALDVLEATIAGLTAQSNLSAIGDFETIPSLAVMHSEMPVACIEGVLGRRGEMELPAFEELLSLSLRTWEEDGRFSAAFQQESQHLEQVMKELFQARKEAIRQAAAEALDGDDFWRWISWGRQQEAAILSGTVENWHCYDRYGFSGELCRVLREEVSRLISPAVLFYSQAQETELLNTDYPAVILDLDAILTDLNGGEIPASRQRAEAARKILSSRKAFCKFGIDEFHSEWSETAGRVWTRDLRQEFQRMLESQHGGLLLTVIPECKDAQCLLTEGNLLEFSALEPEFQVVPNWCRWYDEPSLSQTEKEVYFVQRQWEEEISVKTITRTGKIRLEGALCLNDRKAPVSFDRVYSRNFIQEVASSPRMIGEFRCNDQREQMAVGTPTSLRVDRIWSDGEMTDFVRQESLREFADQLEAQLIRLAVSNAEDGTLSALEQAEAFGELAFALESMTLPPESAAGKAIGVLCPELHEDIRLAVTQGVRKKAK